MKEYVPSDFSQPIVFDKYCMTQWYWLARHKENLVIGDRVEIGNFTIIGAEYGVEIQDDVRIGYHCTIMSDSTVDNKHGKILLKRNCAIGVYSTIMPNVTVGENAIVGAYSFVNKDIPDNEIWAGIPVKFIRKESGG